MQQTQFSLRRMTAGGTLLVGEQLTETDPSDRRRGDFNDKHKA